MNFLFFLLVVLLPCLVFGLCKVHSRACPFETSFRLRSPQDIFFGVVLILIEGMSFFYYLSLHYFFCLNISSCSLVYLDHGLGFASEKRLTKRVCSEPFHESIDGHFFIWGFYLHHNITKSVEIISKWFTLLLTYMKQVCQLWGFYLVSHKLLKEEL